MTRLSVLLVTGAIVSGCAGGDFMNLPQEDRDRFFRCRPAIQPARCGTDQDPVYVTMCIRDAQGDYAAQQREYLKQWLVAYGCPPPMVEPERHVAGPPAEPAATAQAPAPPIAAPPVGYKDGFDPTTIHELASSYDEFKDRTTTSVAIPVSNSLTVLLFAVTKGRRASADGVTSMRLGVAEESATAKYLTEPSLIFLVDGRRIIARNLKRYETRAGSGRVLETITTSMTVDDLRTFVGAKLLRGQLDSSEFTLSPAAKADVRAFAERVGAVTLAPTIDGSEYSLPKAATGH